MVNDEVDLIDLYSAYKKTTTYRTAHKAINLILNNNKWFITSIIFGLGFGYYMNTKKAPTFKGEILVESDEIDNYVSENIILGLNTLINDKNFFELEKSGLRKEFYSNIKSIKFITPETETNTGNLVKKVFKLELLIYKAEELAQIELGFINYLNNTPYSTRLKTENTIQFNAEKEELLTEIKELNSISILVKNKFKSEQPFIYNSPSEISAEKLKAKVRIIQLDKSILNGSNYNILKGFTPSNMPEAATGNYPLKAASLSFILTFILIRIFKKKV